MILSGLVVEVPMSMDGGIRFSVLPNSSNGLAKELPFGTDLRMGIMSVAGTTKVAIESQDSPVLFRPRRFPGIQTSIYGSSRD